MPEQSTAEGVRLTVCVKADAWRSFNERYEEHVAGGPDELTVSCTDPIEMAVHLDDGRTLHGTTDKLSLHFATTFAAHTPRGFRCVIAGEVCVLRLDDMPTAEWERTARGIAERNRLAGLDVPYPSDARAQTVVAALNAADMRRIDIETIELVHGMERQQDGFISFCRKVNAKHQDLAGIRVSELRQYLPRLLPWLLADSFFSVNASYRAAPWTNALTGLPSAYRRTEWLRYLNAQYVDLDAYKGGLTWPQAVEVILRAQDENVIPPPSIIVRSGRGVYLLWLLRHEREGAQQRAFPPEIAVYNQINRTMIDRLNAYEPRLHADEQGVNPAGLLRVPGSENTKASQPVVAQIQVTAQGVPVFTLKQLAGHFDIPLVPQLPGASSQYLSGSGRPVKAPGSCPARRKGRIATAHYRLSDILTIAQHVGGIEKGRRWRTIWFVCQVAKTAGLPMGETQALAEQLAEKFRPPYPSDDDDVSVSEIVKAVWTERARSRRFRSDSMAKFFRVTPEIAGEIELRSIIPQAVREARAAAPGPRAQARASRREIVEQMLAEHPGRRPSVRQVRARLQGAGLGGSLRTISADIQAVLTARP